VDEVTYVNSSADSRFFQDTKMAAILSFCLQPDPMYRARCPRLDTGPVLMEMKEEQFLTVVSFTHSVELFYIYNTVQYDAISVKST